MMRRKRKHLGETPELSPFLNLTPCEWNPIFATRRENLKDAIENDSYIEVSRADDENVVRFFMRSEIESDACLPRADKVEDYCFGATLEELALPAAKGEAGEPTVAWLDERSGAGAKERARTYRGPLTARRLYQELKRPRYYIRGAAAPSEVSKSGSAGPADLSQQPDKQQPETEEQPEPEPDAERRKVFITDLDRWSIYALIGTASEFQASGLRDAIYRHLAFESFIGVTIPPLKIVLFQLAFHIPFYAWRVSDKACEDHRLDRNASRLRQSKDISFLNWKSSGTSEFLYEAMNSCLVAGTEESRWVAYSFVDTYFDAADESKETVDAYHNDFAKDGGMHADPLTFGVIDAEKAVSTPREYFLSVFRIRIAQVKREWEQVVAKVRQSVREYVQTHSYSLCMSRDRLSSTALKEHDKMVRRSRDWIIQARRLTAQLLQHLSQTVDACKKFGLNYAVYFQNLSEPRNGERSLLAIQTEFHELESLKTTLECLAESCTEFAQDLELHLILKSVEVSTLQHNVAQDNKSLAFIMMIFTSVALSAAIHSMNKDSSSFITPSLGSVTGLALLFAFIGILIHTVQRYQSWCWQIVMTLAGQQSWQAMFSRKETLEDMEQLSHLAG